MGEPDSLPGGPGSSSPGGSIPGSLPGLSASTDLLEREQTSTGEGEHDRFAHFVPKDKIVESAVTGIPVTALCGKKWVPSRDPTKYPVCPDCKRIYDGLRRGPSGEE